MIKLGMIGMSPGNGHPYSWSAIFNGYDPVKMATCPFTVIPDYLAKIDPATMHVEGARVTHIWAQDREVAEHIAAASRIDHVVDEMTDLIGTVDAVILARDDGENHLRLAAPFIEAGIPILIDKLLASELGDIHQFERYFAAGKPIMCCSSTRFITGLEEARERLGYIRTAHAICGKYWPTYGIHLVEGLHAVMGGGIESVRHVGRNEEDIVHLQWADGRHAVVQTFAGIAFAMHFGFYADNDSALITRSVPYESFKKMLVSFVDMVRTGACPLNWEYTVEMAKVVIAGTISLRDNGREVNLRELD